MREFSVDLVGRDFENGLITINMIADSLIHRTTVPSAIDSPIWGMITSIGMMTGLWR